MPHVLQPQQSSQGSPTSATVPAPVLTRVLQQQEAGVEEEGEEEEEEEEEEVQSLGVEQATLKANR